MAYKKQIFSDGQILKAEHLKHIDDGVAAAVQYEEQILTDEQKAQARANIGALAEGDMIAYVDKAILGGAW